ncbi:MAG: hypothetical protein DLM62_06640 [Pseudonocardiales bacterium]|nr:MAG: hypothetical protein DLM62_06640 [Pseudonocardiales bacterium]
MPDGDPVPPAAKPVAIRACLTPDVVAEFDREWEIVLERAKQTKDLAGVHDLLNKWRHLAYAELKEPGSYFRLRATAAHTLAIGKAPPGSVPGEDMKALIR